MPPRRRALRARKPRAGKGRRAVKRKPTGLVNRALHPIPQRFITKMKYAESIQTDANGRYYFNLNSIFDPNGSGVGHQPYGFDTLATLYNRYRVISCGYRIQTNSTTGTVGQSFQVACQPANEVLTVFSMSEMKENPRAKYIIQTTGGGSMTLSNKTYIPSLVGRTKFQYMADDRYQALVTGSPQELAILNLLTSFNGTDTPGPLNLNIMLEYTVEFFDIKHLAQS